MIEQFKKTVTQKMAAEGKCDFHMDFTIILAAQNFCVC